MPVNTSNMTMFVMAVLHDNDLDRYCMEMEASSDVPEGGWVPSCAALAYLAGRLPQLHESCQTIGQSSQSLCH